MDDLPDELLSNIIARLPFLDRFKVAVLSTRLSTLVLSNSVAVSVSPALLIYPNDEQHSNNNSVTTNYVCDEDGNFHPELQLKDCRQNILAAGNGVYWLRRTHFKKVSWHRRLLKKSSSSEKEEEIETTWYVCNPASNSQISVPHPRNDLFGWFNAVCFDPLTSACTLIRAYDHDENTKGFVYVFDFESAQWCRIAHQEAAKAMNSYINIPLPMQALTSVFCGGSLFWLYREHGSPKPYVGVFRVCDKSFKSLELPDSSHGMPRETDSPWDWHYDWHLGGCFKCLILRHLKNHSPMYWILRDHGSQQFSWEFVGVVEGNNGVQEHLLDEFCGSGGYCPRNWSEWRLNCCWWKTEGMAGLKLKGRPEMIRESFRTCEKYIQCTNNPWPAPCRDLKLESCSLKSQIPLYAFRSHTLRQSSMSWSTHCRRISPLAATGVMEHTLLKNQGVGCKGMHPSKNELTELCLIVDTKTFPRKS